MKTNILVILPNGKFLRMEVTIESDGTREDEIINDIISEARTKFPELPLPARTNEIRREYIWNFEEIKHPFGQKVKDSETWKCTIQYNQ